MKRITHKVDHISTLCWVDDSVIDWSSSSTRYHASGGRSDVLLRYTYAYLFDSAISSDDGVYAFIYGKTRTKGLLLKNGELLREINRSYYHANVYEYPVCFASLSDGNTYLVHCPFKYCRIDLENVETGEIVTSHQERDPADFFHSRFLVSPNNSKLISRGWAWHPFDDVKLFDLELALKDPMNLDTGVTCGMQTSELSCASFIDNSQLLLGSHQQAEIFDDENDSQISPGSLAVWNIEKGNLSGIRKIDFAIDCNLYAINDHLAWDMHDHPKVINFKTGIIVDECRDIPTGRQYSSIISDREKQPLISFNSKTKQVAVFINEMIEVLTCDQG